jgi:hypothetical protein
MSKALWRASHFSLLSFSVLEVTFEASAKRMETETGAIIFFKSTNLLEADLVALWVSVFTAKV